MLHPDGTHRWTVFESPDEIVLELGGPWRSDADPTMSCRELEGLLARGLDSSEVGLHGVLLKALSEQAVSHDADPLRLRLGNVAERPDPQKSEQAARVREAVAPRGSGRLVGDGLALLGPGVSPRGVELGVA